MSSRYENRPRERVLSATTVKRQHYVPRLLLRQFGTDEVVEAYDLEDNRSFKASVRDLGVGPRYNNVRFGQLELSTEEWLAEIESAAAPLISELGRDPSSIVSLSPTGERDLARFLSAQLFRVPAFRRQIKFVLERARDQFVHVIAASRPFKDPVLREAAVRDLDAQLLPADYADLSAYMLEGTEDWSNLLLGMPWRTGLATGQLGFYTADNPLAGRSPAIHEWWERGSVWSMFYVFPLSPTAALTLGPRLDPAIDPDQGRVKGARETRDFSDWEVSMLRHIVSSGAVRFLYRPGPHVDRECAIQCLGRIDRQQRRDAVRFHGFDPSSPSPL